MLTAQCIGRIESQREGALVSHISRKRSEMTRPRPGRGSPVNRAPRPWFKIVMGSMGTNSLSLCIWRGRMV